jgi:hypothetical protein
MPKFNQDTFVREFRKCLDDDRATYSPLRAGEPRFEPASSDQTSSRPDFEISFFWRDREFRFLGEIKTRTSPREVKDALGHLDNWRTDGNNLGEGVLLAVPYISSSIANLLEETSVSGIDLNGNYILQTDELIAIRLDQENQYKESGGIKNVFRGTSSIVCRYLLHEPGPHDTVSGIYEDIRSLDGRLSLSTVSKVLSTLDDEMIIEKGDQIQVLQPETLLENLRNEYRPPQGAETIRLDLPSDRSEKEELLTDLLGGVLWVWGGETSAVRYAATTPSQEDVAYTRELPLSDDRLDRFRDERFYNCTLIESRDDFVYFGHDGHWASEIQTYLDLMQGDKREREIARDVEDRILNHFYNSDRT